MLFVLLPNNVLDNHHVEITYSVTLRGLSFQGRQFVLQNLLVLFTIQNVFNKIGATSLLPIISHQTFSLSIRMQRYLSEIEKEI